MHSHAVNRHFHGVNRHLLVLVAVGVAALLTLTGCGSSAEALQVKDTSLGKVVTDSKGMTLYMFDKDKQGAATSSCTGECLVAWPPLFAGDEDPEGEDISADFATINSPDGKKQVTLDGWPLYYYVKDKAPGDVLGQGVGDVWWVMAPDGSLIRTKPAA
jgi:predicted lipoprotein with Yx(FWY)xxD motif